MRGAEPFTPARYDRENHVRLNGQVITNQKHKVHSGDAVEITLPELEPTTLIAEDIPLDILFEDEDVMVINKPAGLVVHPGAGQADGTLVNALLYHCGDSLSGIGGVARPGIVHRLDKDTTGLMLVAKNDHAHQHLSQQLAERSLSRIYECLVWGARCRPSVSLISALAAIRANARK